MYETDLCELVLGGLFNRGGACLKIDGPNAAEITDTNELKLMISFPTMKSHHPLFVLFCFYLAFLCCVILQPVDHNM